MQPDLLRRRLDADVSEQCVIVCACLDDDMSFEEGSVIRDALNRLDTDGWWFFNAGTFIVAFRSARSGAERASACEAALARLRQENSSLPRLAVGSAEGPVLTSIASAGHLDTPPLGNVVNAAFRKRARMPAHNVLERTVRQRGRAVLAMDCVLASAEQQCGLKSWHVGDVVALCAIIHSKIGGRIVAPKDLISGSSNPWIEAANQFQGPQWVG
jgi:hypothetical protein